MEKVKEIRGTEESKVKTQIYIEALEHLKTFEEGVREVIAKFDGKVLNRRFKDAIHELDKNLYCNIDNNRLEVTYYAQHDLMSRKIKGQTISIPTQTFYLFSVYLPSNAEVVKDKRLNSTLLLEKYQEYQQDREKDIAEMKEQLEAIDTILETHRILKQKILDFNQVVNWKLQEVFNIRL